MYESGTSKAAQCLEGWGRSVRWKNKFCNIGGDKLLAWKWIKWWYTIVEAL